MNGRFVATCLSTGALLLPNGLTGQAASSVEGLWGFEYQAGPTVRGELLLTREQAQWTLRVAGFEAVSTQRGDTLRFALPAALGTFRVRLSRSVGGTPQAMWIQATSNNGAPAYASPVRLVPAGFRAWRGLVRPVDERFSLYLAIQRDAAQGHVARFRNPEGNFGGGRRFSVRIDSGNVVLTDVVSGRRRFTQPYDSVAQRIAFDFGSTLYATPRRSEETVAFVPRVKMTTPYDYRLPVDIRDGWDLSTASSEGMLTDSLVALVRQVIATDPLNDTMPSVHSIVVARHGRLVLDEYFHGYDAYRLHDLRSAAKTMTSVLLGAAMFHGAPLSPERVMTPGGATIGNLLTHTSGLACDDDDGDSPGNEDAMQGQRREMDGYQLTLALPQIHAPGTTYAYCSAGINLVGKAIVDVTRRWLPEYFDEHLAQPLRIETYGFNLMPTGAGYGGGGLHMRPRDLLKIGQLFLNGGVWRGRRLVSQQWVTQSTARQQPDARGADDGYAWHRHLLTVGPCRIQSYEASGNGGQFLLVVPSLDLAVVITAGNYGQGALWQSIRERVIARYVASAVPVATRC
jgi:CubicO group peptidase (beta-lactamase class C family)